MQGPGAHGVTSTATASPKHPQGRAFFFQPASAPASRPLMPSLSSWAGRSRLHIHSGRGAEGETRPPETQPCHLPGRSPSNPSSSTTAAPARAWEPPNSSRALPQCSPSCGLGEERRRAGSIGKARARSWKPGLLLDPEVRQGPDPPGPWPHPSWAQQPAGGPRRRQRVATTMSKPGLRGAAQHEG